MPEVLVPSTPATSFDPLASFRSEIDALLPKHLLKPRVDVPAAALVAIGTMPHIEVHRAALVRQFGEAAGRTLDRLVPVAQAAIAAHASVVAAAERDLEPMARELGEVQQGLYLAASALVERGAVHRKALGKLTGGQSYLALVTDTMSLVAWFYALPSDTRAQTKVDAAQLEAADTLAQTFGMAFGHREQALAGTSPEARDRAAMFTLFFRTYDRIRQMLTYVRWAEDDVERIAPSLFGGRTSRKGPVRGPAPNGPAPVSPTPVNPISPDMPGADPFQVT